MFPIAFYCIQAALFVSNLICMFPIYFFPIDFSHVCFQTEHWVNAQNISKIQKITFTSRLKEKIISKFSTKKNPKEGVVRVGTPEGQWHNQSLSPQKTDSDNSSFIKTTPGRKSIG